MRADRAAQDRVAIGLRLGDEIGADVAASRRACSRSLPVAPARAASFWLSSRREVCRCYRRRRTERRTRSAWSATRGCATRRTGGAAGSSAHPIAMIQVSRRLMLRLPVVGSTRAPVANQRTALRQKRGLTLRQCARRGAGGCSHTRQARSSAAWMIATRELDGLFDSTASANGLQRAIMGSTNPEGRHPMATERVAMITAGGSGMGADAARRLAADGFRVAILSSSGKGEAPRQGTRRCRRYRPNQSNEDLMRLVGMTVDAWGRIDVLRQQRGPWTTGAAARGSPDEDWRRGMETVLSERRPPDPAGHANHAAPEVRRHHQRFDVCGVRARSCVSDVQRICARALRPIRNSIADRYATDNIRMNNVLPGFIDTFPSSRRSGIAYR